MPTSPDWTGLEAVLEGEVFRPDTPGYDGVRRPALAQYADARPSAVVRVASDADVLACLEFGRRYGLRVSPRAGGHCFAGWSSGGDVVLDVTLLGTVAVLPVDGDTERTVTVGAGVRLGELDRVLAGHGLAVPVGCGPTVGIAGLTLGGGMGLLGRAHGLTCDNLLAARVVLGDGTVVATSADQAADLHWALRGAGGGQFGVLTSLTLRAVTAPTVTCFQLRWPWANVAPAVRAWQSWSPVAPDRLSAELRLNASASPTMPPVVDVVGVVLHGGSGDVGGSGGDELLDELVAAVGDAPVSDIRQVMPYHEAKQRLSSSGDREHHVTEVSKSEFFARQLPSSAVDALVAELARATPPGVARQVTFTPWGGAYSRVPACETAFPHRAELFLVEHVVRRPTTASPRHRRAARAWLHRSWAAVHDFGSGGVYPNFPDSELTGWARAYHGCNLERLLDIKRRYDPDGAFCSPQSLAELIHHQKGQRS